MAQEYIKINHPVSYFHLTVRRFILVLCLLLQKCKISLWQMECNFGCVSLFICFSLWAEFQKNRNCTLHAPETIRICLVILWKIWLSSLIAKCLTCLLWIWSGHYDVLLWSRKKTYQNWLFRYAKEVFWWKLKISDYIYIKINIYC